MFLGTHSSTLSRQSYNSVFFRSKYIFFVKWKDGHWTRLIGPHLPGQEVRTQGRVCTSQSESPLQLSNEMWLLPQYAVLDWTPRPQEALHSDQLDHVTPATNKGVYQRQGRAAMFKGGG